MLVAREAPVALVVLVAQVTLVICESYVSVSQEIVLLGNILLWQQNFLGNTQTKKERQNLLGIIAVMIRQCSCLL